MGIFSLKFLDLLLGVSSKVTRELFQNSAVEDFSVWNVVVIQVGSIMMMTGFGVCSRIDDCRRLWLDEL